MSKKKKFTEMLAVLVKPETLKQIEEITDEQEVSKSEFIREIIEEKLNCENLEEQENQR